MAGFCSRLNVSEMSFPVVGCVVWAQTQFQSKDDQDMTDAFNLTRATREEGGESFAVILSQHSLVGS